MVIAKGLVEKIGLEQSDLTHKVGDQKVEIHAVMPNHSKAIELVINCLTSPEHGVIKDMKEIDPVGHRIVHGGSTFAQSVLLQDEVIAEVEKLVEIAPLQIRLRSWGLMLVKKPCLAYQWLVFLILPSIKLCLLALIYTALAMICMKNMAFAVMVSTVLLSLCRFAGHRTFG